MNWMINDGNEDLINDLSPGTISRTKYRTAKIFIGLKVSC